MKILRKILIIVVILAIFSLTAEAAEPEEYIEMFESGLSEEYKNSLSDDAFSDVGLGALLFEVISIITGRGGEVVSFLLLLLGGVALISLSSLGGKLSGAAAMAVSIILCCSALWQVIPLFLEVAESISAISEVFAIFVPVASAITVSGGGLNTAAVGGVCMNVTVSVLTRLGTPFFLALAAFGLGVGVISSFGEESLAPLSGSVKKFFVSALGLVCALIMGTMSLQTFVAATKDSASMRAAKYAATSMIPMVGSTVAGAMTTLATGLNYAKGIVGASAVAVISSVLISPLVLLLLYRLAVSLALSFSSYLGVKRAASTLEALRLPFDLFIAVYSVAAVLCIFEIALFLVTGVGVS